MTKKTSPGLTRRQVAAKLGVSLTQVERLVAAGTLRPSGQAGKAHVYSLADVRTLQRDARRAARAGSPEAREEYLRVRTQFQRARAEALERENSVRSGALVSAKEVELRLVEDFTRFRARVLGLPAKLRQQVPTLTAADARVVDRLCRALLEELASMRQAAGAAERGR